MNEPGIGVDVTLVLEELRLSLRAELDSILGFWEQQVMLPSPGRGFYGALDNNNQVVPDAPLGLVMHCRILWAFSEGYRFAGHGSWLAVAQVAYENILHLFRDPEFGGFYWSLTAEGRPLADRKQIYGQAFAIYGLVAYYKVSGNDESLEQAIQCYRLIEQQSRDTVKGGYIEAFTRDWQPLDDLRLSDKDDNECKTMNTHLHIVEAYASLYQAWPDRGLRERVTDLLHLFDQHFIDHSSGHLLLFFNDDWVSTSTLQSYGHDIEAAWLLLQCAEATGDHGLIERYRQLSLPITNAAAEGRDTDGGLWYEYNPAKDQLIKEKHSWPQAEAMIGFYNAWELSNDAHYLQLAADAWKFIQGHLLDRQHGEWFWGVNEDYAVMQKDKAGFWKCPYHNTRACLEIIQRINRKAI